MCYVLLTQISWMDVPCSLSELKPADPNSSAQALALPPTSWAAHPVPAPLPAWGSPDPEPPLCKLCRLWVELAVLHGDGQTLLQAALPEQAACSCFRARNLTGGIEQVVSRHFCVVGAMHFFSSSAVRSSWITLCKLKLRNSQHEAAPGTGRLQPN